MMLAQDMVYAFRVLKKNPGFAAVAICSLGIGIGATSAIYSFADTLILRPLPVAQPSRVVTVTAVSNATFKTANSISYPDYRDLRDHNHTFDGMIATAYSSLGFSADREAQPRMKLGMQVSGNFFDVMGIRPQVGRSFRPDEDQVAGKRAVVMLSHDFWVTEFRQDPAVYGKTLWLNGTEFTIIGVTPETFPGIGTIKPALYIPLGTSAMLTAKNFLTNRDVRWLEVKGRLKPNVGLAQAAGDIDSIVMALRSMYPTTDADLKLKVETEFQLRAERSPPDTALLIMLGLLAICVLLVACANVTGLLLSRSTIRTREIALRLAVGASRASLIRQLLLENLILSFAGGVAGLFVAYVAIQFFRTIPLPSDIPFNFNFDLDERAMAFTAGVALLSTFVFGLTPALGTTRVDLMKGLKERDATATGTTRWRGRNVIVAGQVALSLVLLIVSAVLLSGFRSQTEQGPGFRIDHLQLMSFNPDLLQYKDAQRDLFYDRLLDSARQAPEVESAALTSNVPLALGASVSVTGVLPEGHQLRRGEEMNPVFDSVVSPGYFETLAIPLVEGRGFRKSDAANAPPVAIVNEQFARHYWPNQNPLGKMIRLKAVDGKEVQVVGVVKTTKYLWITEMPLDYLYLPFLQNPQPGMALVVQSKAQDAAGLVPVLRRIVQRLDRNMPVFEVRTMRSLYETRAVATPNILIKAVTVLGAMGLVLSVIGLYGVASYSVSQRTREFGIRMALGADRSKVMQSVLKQSLQLGAAGVAVGLVAAVLATRMITSLMLFAFSVGIAPFLWVSVLLFLTIMLAGYLPARRASLIDPMRCLRDE